MSRHAELCTQSRQSRRCPCSVPAAFVCSPRINYEMSCLFRRGRGAAVVFAAQEGRDRDSSVAVCRNCWRRGGGCGFDVCCRQASRCPQLSNPRRVLQTKGASCRRESLVVGGAGVEPAGTAARAINLAAQLDGKVGQPPGATHLDLMRESICTVAFCYLYGYSTRQRPITRLHPPQFNPPSLRSLSFSVTSAHRHAWRYDARDSTVDSFTLVATLYAVLIRELRSSLDRCY